jgi:PKD repeat protein
MKKSGFLFLGLLLAPSLVSAAIGDIVIQEALFDPSGTDTGLEYIILKNQSSANINMTGWNLYPDGIGYFIFPTFSLAGGETVKIHLRTSGVNDAKNLYHESVSSNMGNSSGSIAVFTASERNKDTIQVFVRYHKPGSSERKTWESTAVEAGLWQGGDFLNIESIAEGQVIFLSNPDNFKSSQGWSIKTLESGESESSSSQQSESSSGSDSGFTYIPPENLPQIKAYAGKDRTVTVGANVEFRGQAFGLNDEPLDNARYLWTFGDGASKEGKNIIHIYQYPGNYIVALNVSSGEYSASNYILVKAIPNQVFISEIKTGADSFIELENKSKEEIDLSDCQIKYNNQIFTFPQATRVRPNTYLVIPSSVSGTVFYSGKGIVELLYPGGFKADSFSYNGFPLENQSFNRIDSGSWIGPETPGAKNSIITAISKIISSPENKNMISGAQNQNKISEKPSGQENTDQTANIIIIGQSNIAKSNTKIYLLAVLGLILLAGAAVLFIRHRGNVSG